LRLSEIDSMKMPRSEGSARPLSSLEACGRAVPVEGESTGAEPRRAGSVSDSPGGKGEDRRGRSPS